MEPSENTIFHHQEDEELENVQPKRVELGKGEEEDKEDALSLRDLPLNDAGRSAASTSASSHQDPAADLFEFLTSASYDVSPAENIIFCGKLIPLNDQNALPQDTTDVRTNTGPRTRVRSDSLPDLQGDKLSRSSSVPQVIMRNSRSLDDRKVTSATSKDNSSRPPLKSAASAKNNETASYGGKIVRPRWYVIMFGLVRVPPEIELRDIKIRQTRRNNPHALFPSTVERSSGKSRSSSPPSSWRFLKALSCKEPTNVAATAPFWVPHA